MAPLSRRQIARRYLPDQHLYWYALGKLAMDPLYDAVRAVLAVDRAPLLDVGCGIGILLHCLRATGHEGAYVGVDSDAGKLDAARRAAAGLRAAQFQHCDLSRGFPGHRGSIALLDVLQYLEPQAQQLLIANAARCLTPDSVLVMRGGLNDGSWRASLTRAADRFGHAVRWMDASFKSQPKPQELAATLGAHGLQSDFRPAWGRTPFNNWLIVARRKA
ncbi:MAG: methyltransferase domain-containing protein [Steroidobacter sp.]